MYIDKTKYYLIVSVKGLPKIVSFDRDNEKINEFTDISELDLITMHYTKEELLKYANVKESDYKNTKVFVLRMKGYKYPKYYDCIYKTDTNILKPLAEERLTRINFNLNRKKGTKRKSINVNQAEYFDKKMDSILTPICKKKETLEKVISLYQNKQLKEPLLSDHLIELFISLKQNYLLNTYYGLFKEFTKELKSYKKLRGVYLEGLYLTKKQERFDNYGLNDLSYPSLIFGYSDSFLITPYNALKDENNSYFNDDVLTTPSVLDELEHIKTIDNIMRGDFQNKKMGYLFREGGRNLILESMDANDIYNSSKEDLLRAGIIDEKTYFDMQDKSKRRL
mgnify:CR=1 FL=1